MTKMAEYMFEKDRQIDDRNCSGDSIDLASSFPAHFLSAVADAICRYSLNLISL